MGELQGKECPACGQLATVVLQRDEQGLVVPFSAKCEPGSHRAWGRNLDPCLLNLGYGCSVVCMIHRCVTHMSVVTTIQQ